MNDFKSRKTFTRESFSTDLTRRILEPEEVISGDEGRAYAKRQDDRSLTNKMLAFDIFERLKLSSTSTVLEVCCGNGSLAYELSNYIRPDNIRATDGSFEFIDNAKEKFSHCSIDFSVENIHEMNSPNKYDAVICKDSFHHFTDPEISLKELMIPVMSGGYLYIFDLTRAANDIDIENRLSSIRSDHEAMRFLRSLNASLTPEEFRISADLAGISNLEILHPFVYSDKNIATNKSGIMSDKTGEWNSSLFAVYIIKK